MKDYIDYPFSTVIYSKDAFVRLHRRCFFKGKSVRPTLDQVIDHVVWEHSGKGSGAFFTETHCDPFNGGRTRFCLQDIIDICKYNDVPFEQNENTIILKTTYSELYMKVQAIIVESNNKMYITWTYRPYTLHNSITPLIYMNELQTEEHQITVLDMEQLKHMFDFDKL